MTCAVDNCLKGGCQLIVAAGVGSDYIRSNAANYGSDDKRGFYSGLHLVSKSSLCLVNFIKFISFFLTLYKTCSYSISFYLHDIVYFLKTKFGFM